MRLRPWAGSAMVALLLVSPVAATAASSVAASTASASPASPSVADRPKPTLTLQAVAGSGGERTYQADLRLGGVSVRDADLDIGALGDDPDLRVPTQPMAAAGTSYRASLTFPSGGDWVIVVRSHTPVQIVELFTVRIDGIPEADHAVAAASPSRRAMLRLDPTGIAAESGSTHRDTTVAGAISERRSFDLEAILMRILHSLGAMAWAVSVLGLVLANRLGPGRGREQVLSFIADRYTTLAGVGLLVVVFTGLITMQRSSAGLLDPATLLRSEMGTAYLCVFAAKMVAVAVSMFTSVRIGRLLSPGGSRSGASLWGRHARTRLVGAAPAVGAGSFPAMFASPEMAMVSFPSANGSLAPVGVVAGSGSFDAGSKAEDPNRSSHCRVFRLAETNAAIAGFILVAVAVLGQLHGLIH